MFPFMQQKIVIITGPTGSGKSNLAMLLAEKIPAVIINADSMQVYREIPVITAQPTAEEQAYTPHRLYGCMPARERCTVVGWLNLAIPEIEAAWKSGKTPVMVGGTGMYLKHLLEGRPPTPKSSDATRKAARALIEEIGNAAFHAELAKRDPETAARLDVGNTQRILRAYEVVLQTGVPLSEWQKKPLIPYFDANIFHTIALAPDRHAVYDAVNKRFETMVDKGALEEARAMKDQQLDPHLPAMKAHGVPELIAYIEGRMTLPDAITRAQTNTRQYIKRQFTWLNNQMPTVPQHQTAESALSALLRNF